MFSPTRNKDSISKRNGRLLPLISRTASDSIVRLKRHLLSVGRTFIRLKFKRSLDRPQDYENHSILCFGEE